MKNRMWAICTFTILSIFSLLAKQPAADDFSAADPQAAFEKLKSMAGIWRGTIQDKEKGPAVEVRYRVIAHQTVVVESLFPETDHEMMTVYYMDGDELMATHYCAMGNQPRYRLTRSDNPKEFRFEFAGGGHTLNAEEDTHMHGGKIVFLSDDKIESEWDVYRGGKKEGSNRFFIRQIH